jgi:hypothetical protein
LRVINLVTEQRSILDALICSDASIFDATVLVICFTDTSICDATVSAICFIKMESTDGLLNADKPEGVILNIDLVDSLIVFTPFSQVDSIRKPLVQKMLDPQIACSVDYFDLLYYYQVCLTPDPAPIAHWNG